MEESAHSLFRDIVENTNDLIQVIAPDGRFLYVNKAWLTMLGYSRKDIKKLSVRDIIHPSSQQHCSNILTQLIAGQSVSNFETELITKIGGKVFVEVSSHCKFIHGKARYIKCIIRDISDRKGIERELQRSEKKYFDLYQNAPDGYYSAGSDGVILEVNNTWIRMLGYKRDEVIGRLKITDLLTDEGLITYDEIFSELKRKGSLDNLEFRYKKKDGSLLPVLKSAVALYDDNRNFLKSSIVIRDISMRVSYRHMIEQSLEEWRITFDSMPYGVVLLDMDFSIKRANKYFSLIYNIPYKEIKDQKSYEIINSDHLRDNYQALRERDTISLNTFEYYEERVKQYFLMNLTPIPDVDGITKSFILTFIDITKIKDTEKKLTDSRDAFFNMLKELDFSYKEMQEMYEGLIHSFVNAIDAKSPWTKGHSERVTKYALSIGEEAGLDSEELEILRIAALLHDIGKIGTYDIILDNPHKLSSEEISLINMHPVNGEMILKPIKQLQNLMPIIRHHHEKMDGSGYPDGLKGEEIPFLARIICVADAFDSMTSDRPYRSARTREYAISELQRCSKSQFDSFLIEAFLGVLSGSGKFVTDT